MEGKRKRERGGKGRRERVGWRDEGREEREVRKEREGGSK